MKINARAVCGWRLLRAMMTAEETAGFTKGFSGRSNVHVRWASGQRIGGRHEDGLGGQDLDAPGAGPAGGADFRNEVLMSNSPSPHKLAVLSGLLYHVRHGVLTWEAVVDLHPDAVLRRKGRHVVIGECSASLRATGQEKDAAVAGIGASSFSEPIMLSGIISNATRVP